MRRSVSSLHVWWRKRIRQVPSFCRCPTPVVMRSSAKSFRAWRPLSLRYFSRTIARNHRDPSPAAPLCKSRISIR